MDWLSFTSNIIASLAWPLTVVLIIIILRSPISELILSIDQITGKNWKVRFRRGVQQLGQQVDEALQLEREEIRRVTPDEHLQRDYERYYNMAYDDARSAVISSWLLIEEAVRDLAKRKDLDIKHYPSTHHILQQLFKEQIVSQNFYDIINSARNLRNEAIYSKRFSISPQDAQNYIATAEKIASYLRSIN